MGKTNGIGKAIGGYMLAKERDHNAYIMYDIDSNRAWCDECVGNSWVVYDDPHIIDITNALNLICFELDRDIDNMVAQDFENEYFSINESRNGRFVLWYLDENDDICIYIDNNEFLTEKEIEKQLL